MIRSGGGHVVDGHDSITLVYGTDHSGRTVGTNHLLDAPSVGINLQSNRSRIECDRVRGGGRSGRTGGSRGTSIRATGTLGRVEW